MVRDELKAMVDMGVTEESHNDWSSLVGLFHKTSGLVWFCVDFRKLIIVSTFDPYPMPRIDELPDHLRVTCFYSTLDLTKGYWQISLTYRKYLKKKWLFPLCLGTPVCHRSVWVIWSPCDISASHGQNSLLTKCMCCCLFR